MASGRQFLMVACVSNFTCLKTVSPGTREFFSVGVSQTGQKTVRDVNRLVVYPGLLFRTTLSPHGNPPSLFSWLLVTICSARAKGGYPIINIIYNIIKFES